MSELGLPGELLPLTRERRDELVARRLDFLAERLLADRYAQPFVEPSAGTPGYQELLVGVQPAAGQVFRYRVPGGEVVRLLSVLCQLATDATVAQRSLTLEYRDDQDVRYLVAGTPATLGASQTQSFCWHPLAGGVTWPVDDVAIAPLPQQMIYPTHSIVLKIGNAGAGDQLSLVRLSVDKYQLGEPA